MLALLQYHYKDTEVDKLPDNRIIELFARLEWARQQEAKINPLAKFFQNFIK